MTGYVSYMDILGFTAQMNSEDSKRKDVFESKYKELVSYIGGGFVEDTETSIYVVSDSIIVTSQKFENVKAYSKMIYTWGMNNDFWIRGAITQGEVVSVDVKDIVKDNRNVIFPYLGEAYMKAYKLESELNMAGIVIDRDVVSNHPDLPLLENEDYIEYKEYFPKKGNEGRKKLLIPCPNFEQKILDTMYFEMMIESHINDIDKYINTFSYYIELVLKFSALDNIHDFIEKLREQLGISGRRILIPPKVMVIFVALMRGLINLYRSGRYGYLSKRTLELEISTQIDALKQQGYLPVFTDLVLKYDSDLYKDIYQLRADIENFK